MPVYTQETLVSAADVQDLARCAMRLPAEMGVRPSQARAPGENALQSTDQSSVIDGGIPIYDVQGRLLFRDYVTVSEDGGESRVRVAASKVFGIPIVSTMTRKATPVPWVERAIGLLNGKRGTDTIVCHSYPRLGLLRTNGGEKWLVDFAGGPPLDVSPGSPGEASTWSLYDRVAQSEVNGNVAQWGVVAGQIRAAAVATPQVIVPGVPLEGQDCSNCCAPAVAAMILGFYHTANASEVRMRQLMRTDLLGPGTSPQDEENAYRVAAPQFTIVRVNADWNAAVQEIAAGRPFKTGLNGAGSDHARAVVGYVDNAAVQVLIVNDPLPMDPDGGAVWREAWSSLLHTDFLFVRP
ncbi:MAG TPA: C39 family peptidase [Thermoanaerobaculia bacterium]|jgi:hypothetical protein|nr:C39 family peptidase [Thermoanaerobaculia bacterium]